jgi:hypothetical protein
MLNTGFNELADSLAGEAAVGNPLLILLHGLLRSPCQPFVMQQHGFGFCIANSLQLGGLILTFVSPLLQPLNQRVTFFQLVVLNCKCR